MRTRNLFTIGLMLFLIAGCGKKGPVRPAIEKLPEAVESARILQRGAEFQVQWIMPKRNQDGSSLTDLENVSVERLFSFEADFCAECRDPWPMIAHVHADLPAPAQNVGEVYFLSDQGAEIGQTARYRLQAHNRLADPGLPLTLQQQYREPVVAPTGLNAISHDRSVELRWNPAAIPAGAKLIGYQIYRREEDNHFLPLPINLRPVKKLEFSDFGLQNSRTYLYRVRSLLNFGGQRLESLPSDEISVRPKAG
jgi:predicted small lipoprotein YifL